MIAAAYASMGVSIVVIEETAAGWRFLRDARPGAGLNRRITSFSPMVFAGPASAHPWIKAGAARFNAAEKGAGPGAVACGTHSNCAGGETPWGTYLSVEENFNSYFFNSKAPAKVDPLLALDAKVMGYPLDRQRPRPNAPRQFDLADNPTGATLYGWTVEIDPYDPSWTPRKRTALGRRKGECATTALTRDGRVAVYAGDDQADEFVFKFVSTAKFNPADRLANRDILDDGVLHAAQFQADGAGRWIALTLEASNQAAAAANHPAFRDLGDLMIRAREAARLLGATPMDRPEDVEAILDANWVGQGPVLIVCTNNRGNGAARPANPRRPGEGAQPNHTGHIVRIDEAGADAAAAAFTWDIFALAGDPDAASDAVNEAGAHVGVAVNGAATFIGDRFACPDNICFDQRGQVWIATDGSESVFADCNDAVLVTPVTADGPRPVKRFLTGPVGSEICGPMLSPDERTLFVAIQHPGETDAAGVDFASVREKGARPASSFPEGNGAWPRSAVVAVRRKDGGVVGA
jgi:secreted PhoX family phosphatase